MPRQAAGLTARQVKTKRPGTYADGGGLYLRVTDTAAWWIFRFTMDGKRPDMGRGSTSLYTLAEARQKALEARKLVAEGINPIEARRSQRITAAVAAAKTMSFREWYSRFIAGSDNGDGKASCRASSHE